MISLVFFLTKTVMDYIKKVDWPHIRLQNGLECQIANEVIQASELVGEQEFFHRKMDQPVTPQFIRRLLLPLSLIAASLAAEGRGD